MASKLRNSDSSQAPKGMAPIQGISAEAPQWHWVGYCSCSSAGEHMPREDLSDRLAHNPTLRLQSCDP